MNSEFHRYQRMYLDADLAIEQLESKISKGFLDAAKEYLHLESVKSAITAAYGTSAWNAYDLKLTQLCG